jgi:hypothetical protein
VTPPTAFEAAEGSKKLKLQKQSFTGKKQAPESQVLLEEDGRSQGQQIQIIAQEVETGGLILVSELPVHFTWFFFYFLMHCILQS